ncbi:beta-1,4-mannosyltransferase [Gammaproteobacteria bacterium]
MNNIFWWRQVEQIRLMRQQQGISPVPRHPLIGYYTPNYQNNWYQKILYRETSEGDIPFVSLENRKISLVIEDQARNPQQLIIHQHWLRQIFFGLRNNYTDRETIDQYFGRLYILRALGAKLLWSVHNLYEHDINCDERELNQYVLQWMSRCSDLILFHNESARFTLEQLLKIDLGDKARVLPHPLYDSMLQLTPQCPPEISPMMTKWDRSRYYLCFGLLRPYKGTEDLVRQFISLHQQGALQSEKLVIAGRINDDALRHFLAQLTKKQVKHLIVIDRRLTDAELAWLCLRTDIAVLPYRAIFTSGSYYQASVFALPCIVPNLGMFTEMADGNQALKYHPPDGLAEALLRTRDMGRDELQRLGKQALDCCNGQTEVATARRFQQLVRQLWKTQEA